MKRNITLISILIFLSCRISSAQIPDWIWANSVGGLSYDETYSIAVDQSGNIYTTGIFFDMFDFDHGPGTTMLTSAGDYDIFISKSDNQGNLIWAQSFGGSDYDRGLQVIVDPKTNDIYFTGTYKGNVDFDPGAGITNLYSGTYSNVFVAKLDSAGNFIWAKGLTGPGGSGESALAIDTAGNGAIYITGEFGGTVDFDPSSASYTMSSATGGDDAFFLKLDFNGDFGWANMLGGSFTDGGHSITADHVGHIYITGHYSLTADLDPGPSLHNSTAMAFSDIYIMKCDTLGNLIWVKTLKGDGWDWGRSIVVSPLNDMIYISGGNSGSIDLDPGPGILNFTAAGNYYAFILKLDSSGNFVWAKTMGEMTGYGNYLSLYIDQTGTALYAAGDFSDTVDFDSDTALSYVVTSSGSTDIFVTKFSSSGNMIWTKTTGGIDADRANTVTLDPSGNQIYIAGTFYSPSVPFGQETLLNVNSIPHASCEIYIAKLDMISNVDNKEHSNKIQVFPNPTSDLIYVLIPGNETATFRIADLSEKLIYSGSELKNSSTINTKDFPAGIYLLEVFFPQEIIVKKIIVTKE
jgi:hypothetical protein